jgi:hypothetical protein
MSNISLSPDKEALGAGCWLPTPHIVRSDLTKGMTTINLEEEAEDVRRNLLLREPYRMWGGGEEEG